LVPDAFTTKPAPAAPAVRHRVGRQPPPARDRGRRHHEHIHEELHPVLRHQFARQIPDQGGLAVLKEPARSLFRIAQLDLGTGRTGGTKGHPTKLQLGRCLRRALADEIKRKSLGLLVSAFVEDFDAVDDRAHRTDQVMADARAQKGRKIEGSNRDGTGYGGRHDELRLNRMQRRGVS